MARSSTVACQANMAQVPNVRVVMPVHQRRRDQPLQLSSITPMHAAGCHLLVNGHASRINTTLWKVDDGLMFWCHSRNNATVDGQVRGPAWSQETLHGERRKETIKKENNFTQVRQTGKAASVSLQQCLISSGIGSAAPSASGCEAGRHLYV